MVAAEREKKNVKKKTNKRIEKEERRRWTIKLKVDRRVESGW